MLTIKVFHLLLAISWFAGLFYLPRILVNLGQVLGNSDQNPSGNQLTDQSEAVSRQLVKMAKSLLKFMNLLMVGTIILGVELTYLYYQQNPELLRYGWFHIKIFMLICLVGYQHYCQYLLKNLENKTLIKSQTWLRVFNEIPVFLLLIILSMVIIQPKSAEQYVTIFGAVLFLIIFGALVLIILRTDKRHS
ncbi:MAG: CopD family protein [Gammaproteobacteria bacterium]|nr:CopD family protein [Gammaproteobacteria bacterium]